MTASLLAGAAIGLSVAAPFGPISLLCVQKSLDHGYRHGLVAGFGAAAAHGIFATAAIIGVGVASAVFLPWAFSIRLLSALILIVLGARTVMRARAAIAPAPARNLCATFASLFVLALSNPMTIIPYLALATVAAGGEGEAALSLWSVPGVMLAAATWYAGLCTATAVMRRSVSAGVVQLLNLVAGASLIGFGSILGSNLLGVLAAAAP